MNVTTLLGAFGGATAVLGLWWPALVYHLAISFVVLVVTLTVVVVFVYFCFGRRRPSPPTKRTRTRAFTETQSSAEWGVLQGVAARVLDAVVNAQRERQLRTDILNPALARIKTSLVSNVHISSLELGAVMPALRSVQLTQTPSDHLGVRAEVSWRADDTSEVVVNASAPLCEIELRLTGVRLHATADIDFALLAPNAVSVSFVNPPDLAFALTATINGRTFPPLLVSPGSSQKTEPSGELVRQTTLNRIAGESGLGRVVLGFLVNDLLLRDAWEGMVFPNAVRVPLGKAAALLKLDKMKGVQENRHCPGFLVTANLKSAMEDVLKLADAKRYSDESGRDTVIREASENALDWLRLVDSGGVRKWATRESVRSVGGGSGRILAGSHLAAHLEKVKKEKKPTQMAIPMEDEAVGTELPEIEAPVDVLLACYSAVSEDRVEELVISAERLENLKQLAFGETSVLRRSMRLRNFIRLLERSASRQRRISQLRTPAAKRQWAKKKGSAYAGPSARAPATLSREQFLPAATIAAELADLNDS